MLLFFSAKHNSLAGKPPPTTLPSADAAVGASLPRDVLIACGIHSQIPHSKKPLHCCNGFDVHGCTNVD
ncbi:hypothetical protein [Pseudoalteromonas sp. S2755]|uniref:hypothetical protein n=1 Tax=Pseudoalteromonas sp. S2755 TaxID=2066523 RepID=UPI00110A3059|nr:hypothetical protein [Pseudoalteromonas sp. S2755]TMN33937.1 hypothetical protein CWC03_17710 [Pseudoalteromonas sp. S2755]